MKAAVLTAPYEIAGEKFLFRLVANCDNFTYTLVPQDSGILHGFMPSTECQHIRAADTSLQNLK